MLARPQPPLALLPDPLPGYIADKTFRPRAVEHSRDTGLPVYALRGHQPSRRQITGVAAQLCSVTGPCYSSALLRHLQRLDWAIREGKKWQN
jgi:hypothetical protein